MHDPVARLEEFSKELGQNPKLKLERFDIAAVPDDVEDYGALFDDGQVAPGILAFYKRFNGFDCRWRALEPVKEASGAATFLPMERVLLDWSGSLYPADTPADARIRSFVALDLFDDKGCVGFYTGPDKNESMYFYDMGHEPLNLNLNIEGYFQLLVNAKAARYWQYFILEILNGEPSTHGNTLRGFLPGLFGDFDMKQFIALYSKHRLAR